MSWASQTWGLELLVNSLVSHTGALTSNASNASKARPKSLELIRDKALDHSSIQVSVQWTAIRDSACPMQFTVCHASLQTSLHAFGSPMCFAVRASWRLINSVTRICIPQAKYHWDPDPQRPESPNVARVNLVDYIYFLSSVQLIWLAIFICNHFYIHWFYFISISQVIIQARSTCWDLASQKVCLAYGKRPLAFHTWARLLRRPVWKGLFSWWRIMSYCTGFWPCLCGPPDISSFLF